MKMTGTLVKLGIFVLVTSLGAFGVAALVGNFRFAPRHHYVAIFDSVEGVVKGSEVRIAGVPVGTVTALGLAARGKARVTFEVNEENRLTSTTKAVVRYKNLIGERYVQLVEGDAPGDALAPGATIPNNRTTPALDLDQVVNGFKPLLQGLSPSQVNKLSTSLVAVLDGREAAVSELISDLGVLTNSLADHDAAIGKAIDNFSVVMTTINERRDDTGALVTGLTELVRDLGKDTPVISNSLVKIDDLTKALGVIVTSVQSDLPASIANLGTLAQGLNKNSETLQLVLGKLPKAYQLMNRVTGYGSWINFFVCGIGVKYGAGPQDATPVFTVPAERCKG
ncbi:MlaD family protein [Tsukamurella paurometabola]|uniref:MCE family protein n=1 Tax=Tsukamurella paurometabola TaxID=2061 RepID=A0ABS5NGJ3_TSUPA|nr:MlaD family protein [Tsukamurella paurometabola]MBS4102987.1 MCE family protein [Tsukamurella paurometabola]